MNRITVLSLISLVMIISSSLAGAAILIDDGSGSIRRTSTKRAKNGYQFRQQRRVGVSSVASGAYGVAGLQFNLNFSEDISFATGFGLGSGFQSFNLKLKSVIAGRRFLPYVAAGYARWYTTTTNNGGVNKSTPGFLAKRFLSEEERKSGEFAENLLYPAIGVEYVQLDGSWSGFSIAAEILMLLDIDDFASAPTGAIAMGYYF